MASAARSAGVAVKLRWVSSRWKPTVTGDAWKFYLKQSWDTSPADYPSLAGLLTERVT